MPYENEWSARIEDPSNFKKFRRQNDKFGNGIHVIWGIDKNSTKVQAIRFDKDKFKSKTDVRDWLKKHEYKAILVENNTSKKFSEIYESYNMSIPSYLSSKMVFDYKKDYNDPNVALFTYVVNGRGKNLDASKFPAIYSFEMDIMIPVGATGWMRTKDPKLKHDFQSKADLIEFLVNVNTTVLKRGGRFLKTSLDCLKRLLGPLNEQDEDKFIPKSEIVEFKLMINKDEQDSQKIISEIRSFIRDLKQKFLQQWRKDRDEWKRKTAHGKYDPDLLPEPIQKLAEIEIEYEPDVILLTIRIEDEEQSELFIKKFKEKVDNIGFWDEF